MTPLFRLSIDVEVLIDDIYAYVTEPHAAIRNTMPIVDELRDSPVEILPWELVEAMVLDGVNDRQMVADLVHYLLAPYR